MNYFLLKLAFDTAVHFGGSDSAVGSQSSALTLRADTIFSALCHTALEVYGEPALEELLVSADADALRISDAMPWRGNSFYLPKPIAASTSPAELSTVERKAVKKLAWIPASKFDRYTASLHSGTYPLDELDQSFGQAYEQTKASVTDGADAKPYFVGLYRLHAGCGLYVLCACEGNDQLKMLKELFTLLGLSGIGDRTSAVTASYNGTKEIHQFQRDAYGRAYIPGSSLKGALRTAGLVHLLLHETPAPGKKRTLEAFEVNHDYVFPEGSYPIKNTRIPGFVGSAVVEARLALPLLELWNALLSFAPYGGIGIKTALGMGGVSVEPLVLPQRSL